MSGTTTHICVPIDRALEELAKGNNLFTGTPLEAFHALMDSKNAGKEYFTGCDAEDETGRCKGHKDI